MKLKTEIQDSDGSEINYRVSHRTSWNDLCNITIHIVELTTRGLKLGYMTYSIQQNYLYIHRMNNLTVDFQRPFKYVGTALFEYAFRQSIQAGKDGRIELDAIEKSPGAYFRMGFRKKCGLASCVQSSIITYSRGKTEQTKNDVLQHKYYRQLKQNTQNFLKKQHPSFVEIITYGLLDEKNLLVKEKIQKRERLTHEECFSLTGPLYLPPYMIEKKRREFASKAPAGSHFFFNRNKKFATEHIRNNTILALMHEGKIDPTNAVDIDNKFNPNDARLQHLLSPVGLKMIKENYLSAWWIGAHVFDVEYVKLLTSENAHQFFKEGFARDISKFKLTFTEAALILNEHGLKAFRNGILQISRYGHFVYDKKGNKLDEKSIKSLLSNVNNLSNDGSGHIIDLELNLLD